MSPPPEPIPPARRRVPSVLIPLFFWAAGMALAHGPMIASGLGRVQGNLGDPRMVHYMLEHAYRWMSGDPAHARFWDPPTFYPARNAAAYSETVVGASPLYAIWRLVGVPADVAYPLWLLLVSTLNFACACFLLRDGLARGPAASAFGAFLFAFASARIAHLGHPQLLPGFYGVLAVHALLRVVRADAVRPSLPWLALFAAGMAGQAYSSFYLAWFLGLALGLALLWALALPDLRPRALATLRRHGPGLAGAAAVAALCLVPFLRHSLRASAAVGFRPYDEVDLFLPRPLSWIQFGPEHWLYGWLSSRGPFETLPLRSTEHALGFGLVTLALAARGLWDLRKAPVGRILLAVSLTLLLCTLRLPGGASLWSIAYLAVPGAKAVRAVSRVSMLLLLPAAVGAAYWLEGSRWKRPLVVVAVAMALLEQGRSTPSFDRREARDSVAAIASRVDASRAAFLYTARRIPPGSGFLDSLPPRIHVDAMMASLVAGVPTVNGYSGWSPPDWPFESLAIAADERGEAAVAAALEDWCRRNGLDPARVQWIRDNR